MKQSIRALAFESGFDACRFGRVMRAKHAEAYLAWLEEGSHGEMAWLNRDPSRRCDPSHVLPGAKTILVLAKNYFQGDPVRSKAGKIARYAWGEDYHPLMLEQMKPIDQFLSATGHRQKCYVDTGPILERDFAAVAGLSWQGKSTMCLNAELGTWFFIGVILTTLEMDPDEPIKNRCGNCTRCIDACPTNAITAPYHLDARRCISYLTIENKGSIPIHLRTAIGDRIYGCDDCLDACPWNRFAKETRETKFTFSDEVANKSLQDLANLTSDEFRILFRDSPIKRIKRNRFIRNVCVALGNVGTKDDLAQLTGLSADPDPLIAEHAAWAVQEIVNRNAL
jgi:epoxyqueuosine reductase